MNKLIRPCIKQRTLFIHGFDDIRNASVTSCKNALQNGFVRIVILISYALLVQLRHYLGFNDSSLFPELIFLIHRCPLKRCKRLRYKERRARRYLRFSVSFLFGNGIVIRHRCLLAKMSNLLYIILCFSRQTKHKIKLNLIPSALKCLRCSVEYILLCKAFIYYISHTLASRLGRKCKTAFLDVLNFRHYVE